MPDSSHDTAAITELLIAWSDGYREALDRLAPIVYEDLRQLAAGYMRREPAGHALQPTALVHEAYLRLIDQRQVQWRNRAHFFGVAAQMMRRILVDHARERHAAKRPPVEVQLELDETIAGASPPEVEVLMLDSALHELAALDARQSTIVELKYFGGLSEEDVAVVLSVSRTTVTREWQAARAWLYRRMTRLPRE